MRTSVMLVAVGVLVLSGGVLSAAETRTFTYKKAGERELDVIVHYPADWKSSDSRGAIVFFFGGGWNSGSVGQFEPQAEYFASRGLVTARADYRVKSRDGVTPDKCVEDARSAVRWMRANAGKLGIDPEKLVTAGGSAGGHLAACAAIKDCVDADTDDMSISTVPYAMLLYNPVLTFEHRMMRSRLGKKTGLAAKISPAAHLSKKTPPSLILFGTDDHLKPLSDSYFQKAEELDLRVVEFTAEGQKHGFFNRSPWLEKTTVAADRFLASLGLVKGEPTMKVQEAGAADRRSRGVHPDSSDWPRLFASDLSNAIYPEGVWTVEDGVFTASEDQALWTKKDYENFVLDLEFKTAAGSNSGVVVYCTDMDNWIPNSVEIQIADDYADKWANSPASWHCGAVFGHVAPKSSEVKKPGQWNRMTIRCRGQRISIALNGDHVTSMDMSKFTSAKTNPDGTEIPAWLNKPLAEHPTKGRIGLQGKHAGAPIWFRNIKIRQLR